MNWNNLGNLGGWTLKMLAFDQKNNLWCVGTAGNVGQWDSSTFGWDDQGNLGGWTLNWLAFRPTDPTDEVYCVGTAGNIGKYEFDNHTMLNNSQNWTLKMITFPQSFWATVWAVGTAGNVANSPTI
ncbi:MAG: hypothetical protein JNN15_14220 [Blastocatellia bacterium]|nr:hypothetical protein [Blastocatellia bacterium]